MPFIRITTFGPPLSPAQIEQLQQGTTSLMAGVMRKPLEGIAVCVENVSSGGWCIAGKAVGVAAHVEATIGLDTNTSEEKSRFMADMMQLLRSVLGNDLKDETYITLHQFGHDSYGRGGLTRAECDRRKATA